MGAKIKIRSFPMTTKSISIAAAALLATALGMGAALAQSNPAPSSHAPMMQGGAHASRRAVRQSGDGRRG
jgi:Spy/CpxP family protein refolding chaperone